MHIIGLGKHTGHMGCRYRLAALRPYLEVHGHRLEVRVIPKGFWPRWNFWKSLAGADVVVLQQRLLPSMHLKSLRRYARRLIFDFDEAVYRFSGYMSRRDTSERRQQTFAATLRAVDEIVAGNEFLKEQATRHVPESLVHVVPTCLDAAAYPMAEHRRKGIGVQLVWVGRSSTIWALERRRPLMDAIAEHVPGIECKVLSDRCPMFKKMPVTSVYWSPETEADELASADIGISWLPDDHLGHGKCAAKILQYMAAGLPVIANPVGLQAQMIRHGETGFLAKTPAEWIKAIQALANDPALRQQMGSAGRRRVERFCPVQRAAELWLERLQPALAHEHSRAA